MIDRRLKKLEKDKQKLGTIHGCRSETRTFVRKASGYLRNGEAWSDIDVDLTALMMEYHA